MIRKAVMVIEGLDKSVMSKVYTRKDSQKVIIEIFMGGLEPKKFVGQVPGPLYCEEDDLVLYTGKDIKKGHIITPEYSKGVIFEYLEND